MNPNVFVKLKGDYDMGFEYTELFVNGKKFTDVCKDCGISCKSPQPQDATEFFIDLDKYCGDESGSGFVSFYFKDSSQVNDCFSAYKVCINVGGEKKCCEKTCEEESCDSTISFDCDDWSCVELKDFMLKGFSCKKDKNKISCTFRVSRNVIDSKLKVSVAAFDEDTGKIYYIGTGEIGNKITGIKTIHLENINECKGKQLTFSLIVADKKIIHYEKTRGFEC